MGDGLNVQFEHITSELVETLHKHNKIICVWIDAEVTKECPKIYCRMFDLKINSYCTDYPLHVQTVWRNYSRLLDCVKFQDEKLRLINNLSDEAYQQLERDDCDVEKIIKEVYQKKVLEALSPTSEISTSSDEGVLINQSH